MICLCTTQTKHTIQTHHSHSVSSVPFSLHHHLSVIQSYNCFMLKHPWQYPTHFIFAPLNLLTNNYTHYPRVLTLNSTHIARNLQLIIYQTEPVKGFWQCHIQNGCHCTIYYLVNAVTISMISNSCLTLMAMVLCWHWGLWHSISSSPASQPSVSQSETNNKERFLSVQVNAWFTTKFTQLQTKHCGLTCRIHMYYWLGREKYNNLIKIDYQ